MILMLIINIEDDDDDHLNDYEMTKYNQHLNII